MAFTSAVNTENIKAGKLHHSRGRHFDEPVTKAPRRHQVAATSTCAGGEFLHFCRRWVGCGGDDEPTSTGIVSPGPGALVEAEPHRSNRSPRRRPAGMAVPDCGRQGAADFGRGARMRPRGALGLLQPAEPTDRRFVRPLPLPAHCTIVTGTARHE